MSMIAKLSVRTGPLVSALRTAAPGLLPAGLGVALLGIRWSSYWLIIAGMVLSIGAAVIATAPPR